ncbi:MAG: AMP-binding protein [Myxococcota bacterium]
MIGARLDASRTGGVWFVDGPDTPFVPWSTLGARAERIAGALARDGLAAGDPVGLAIPHGRPFLEAFLGVTLAGGIPAPMYPPTGLEALDGWCELAGHAVRSTRARFVLVDREVRRVAPALHLESDALRAILTVDDLDGPPLRAPPDPRRPALLQLTSGSTSRPKVVVVRPEHLEANVGAFTRGLGAGPADVIASWLPLYHDMGLVGHTLGALWIDARLALQHPLAFLKRPASWLGTIDRYRATISIAPNFAYDLVERRTSPEGRSRLDLSCWRVAGCGAEPIDGSTLRRFAAAFAGSGFRESAFLPCYGLAEHTLAVTLPPPGRGLVVERGFVGCGGPLPDHTVRIEAPDGRTVDEGVVGEIVARGPSVTTDGALRTGDLGFVRDGELFVCGRLKDLIIVRGRNHHPHDLERAACAVDGVRPGGAAAFAVPGDGGEVAVLIVEADAAEARFYSAVSRAVQDATGLQVRVEVVPPRTLPKTSSGKLRRSEARDRYLAGTLRPRIGGARTLAQAELGRARAAGRRP